MTDPKPPAEDKVTMGDLRKMFTDLVGQIGGGSPKKEETSTDIGTQVREELTRLEERRKRQAANDQLRADVEALKASATKPPEEKTPIERRRVHRIMGWGENKDD